MFEAGHSAADAPLGAFVQRSVVSVVILAAVVGGMAVMDPWWSSGRCGAVREFYEKN
jgi:hypothetical protein